MLWGKKWGQAQKLSLKLASVESGAEASNGAPLLEVSLPGEGKTVRVIEYSNQQIQGIIECTEQSIRAERARLAYIQAEAEARRARAEEYERRRAAQVVERREHLLSYLDSFREPGTESALATDANAAMQRLKELQHRSDILNRPNGEYTEKPVLNVDGLKEKQTVSPAEAERYLTLDREELARVAEEISRRTGRSVTADHARAILAQRMNDLMNASILATHPENSPVTLTALNLEIEPGYRLVFNRDTLAEQLGRAANTADYVLTKGCSVEAQTALLKTDLSPAESSMVRLNVFVLNLANKGVYQKGTSADPHQRVYPTSPLDFYKNHVDSLPVERLIDLADRSLKPKIPQAEK